ncbi:MAG: hypothetical protein J0I21_12740 [Alphaproteobacteria bacterium]|nr:hypothetical protein [Alphaproteobacteria bacterium]
MPGATAMGMGTGAAAQAVVAAEAEAEAEGVAPEGVEVWYSGYGVRDITPRCA